MHQLVHLGLGDPYPCILRGKSRPWRTPQSPEEPRAAKLPSYQRWDAKKAEYKLRTQNSKRWSNKNIVIWKTMAHRSLSLAKALDCAWLRFLVWHCMWLPDGTLHFQLFWMNLNQLYFKYMGIVVVQFGNYMHHVYIDMHGMLYI